MRILLLWDYYPGYLPFFYGTHPDAFKLSYQEHLQAFQDDFFYWPPYLIPYFRSLGHEAEIVIGNSKPLQLVWARENGFVYDEQNWHFSIAQEQIRRCRPDVLIFGGADHYLGSFVKEAKRYCRRVVAWKAVAFSSQLDWSGVDCALSSHRHFVEQFQQLGIASEQVLPCFESRILDYLPATAPDIAVGFVGSLSTVQFSQRMELLDYVRRRLPIEIYAEKVTWRRRPWPLPLFTGQARFVPFLLKVRLHPAVYGLEMFRVLRRSRIVLNTHVDSAGGLAGNIRMFETTGAGSLLVTEAASNLADLFAPDQEVVTYRSYAEAVEKMHYYLAHETERTTIARAGQQRTLRDHNSLTRARQVVEILEKQLNGHRIAKFTVL